MSSAQTLKEIAPFLDPHLLLFTLQKTSTPQQTGELQNQIKGKLLIGQKDNAKKLEDQAKAEASKLLDVLAGPDFQ
jgi:hypothetical protein